MNYVSRDEIALIAASSAGIFSAYALAVDKLDYVEHIYRSVNITQKRELFWQVFAKGLLSKYLDALMDNNDVLTIPLCFPVCYIPLFSVRYYWICGKYNSLWKKYFNAATNYPFLHILPNVLEGRFAIDGGAVDNIPLFALLQKERPVLPQRKLDLILVLHFDARYNYRREFDTDIPVLDLDLSYCNTFQKNHYDYSSESITKRIEKSYDYGERIFSRLFAGDCTKQAFQNTINEIFLEEYALRQRNLSLDHFFSCLNSFGKLLRNHAQCTKRLF